MTTPLPTSPSRSATTALDLDALWDSLNLAALWDGEWEAFDHAAQGHLIHRFVERAPFPVELRQAGSSVEGRALWTLRFGNRDGGKRVLVWARQHGDEPDCTAGLNLILNELATRSAEEPYVTLLREIDFLVFPMVNPDGVARFTRVNAQGIDLNRDAIHLTTPESSTLKRLRDEFLPAYGFNLHDMNPRYSTRSEDKLVALAYQAGPFESRDIDNDVRLRAKAVCSEMARAASRWAPGHLARYTADYMHTAFGDSMMRWGVSSILIEAGGWYPERGGDIFVRKLFALSFLVGLHSVATASTENPSGADYDAIPFIASRHFNDVLLRGVTVLDGGARSPYTGDVAFNTAHRVQRIHDRPPTTAAPRESIVSGIGDLREALAKDIRPMDETLLVPGLIAVAPEWHCAAPLPRPADAAPFLNAGFTTLAAGFGPFPTAKEREDFAATAQNSAAPINLVALERVESVREILQRHGMTELAGFCVSGLRLAAKDFLGLVHLFHPATHSALEADEMDRELDISLIFRGASNPRETRLILQYQAASNGHRAASASVEDLRAFVGAFLRHPGQVFLVHGEANPLPASLSLPASPCGFFGPGGVPAPTHLADVLQRQSVSGSPAMRLSLLVNALTHRMTQALRLPLRGLVRIGYRADLAAFPASLLEGPTPGAAPTLVVLNGDTPEAGRGAWIVG